MDWAFILVIILSVFLALFLLLGIVLIILLIRVTMQIREVTKSAQNTAGTIEKMVAGFSKVTSSAAIGKLIFSQVKKYKKRKDKEEK
jgi:hypothetical protein